MLTPTLTYKGASGVNRAVLAPASLEAGKRVGDEEEAGVPSLLNPTCWARDGVLVAALGRNCWERAASRAAWFLREFVGWIKAPSPLALLFQLLHRCCPQSGAAHPGGAVTQLSQL